MTDDITAQELVEQLRLTIAGYELGPEPEPTYELEPMAIAARHVKSNDVLIFEGNAVKIADVKLGYKNATFTLKSGKTVAFPLETAVDIDRAKETKVSRKLRNKWLMDEAALRGARTWKPKTPAALAAFSEQVQKYGAADSWRVADLLQAQATDAVARGWIRALAYALENKTDKYDGPYAIKLAYAQQLKTNLLRNIRGASRSTSTVSNLVDDLKHEALAQFIDETERGW